MAEKFLIIGLGNPGREYEKTRHNVGFWVIDELVKRHNLSNPTKERKSVVYSGVINGKSVILAKPQTYMNLSGEATRALSDYYKIPLAQLIVIHDDMDTPLGTLRLRMTGGHGGQNGLRNIILHMGGENFARIRFGIGRPPGKMQARDYVLQAFQGDDAILAQQITERAANAVENWLLEGIDLTMTKFNGDNTDGNAPKPNLEDELKIALRAHELAPNDVKPLEALARLYRRAQQFDHAVDMHLKLADLYAKMDKPKQMIFEWDNAVKIRPSLTNLQEKIARENEAHGDSKRATQGWLRLAEYYHEQGQINLAEQAIQEALRINPQHPRALELLKSLST